MSIEKLLLEIHNGLIIDPNLKTLAEALEAERDAHHSTRNILKLAVIGKKKNFPMDSLQVI